MSALVHINRAKTEAENIEFARLPRALAIALAVDELLISTALGSCKPRHHARLIVIDHTIWADRCTHVALCHDEARRARWVPLVFALLAVAALLCLAIASPK